MRMDLTKDPRQYTYHLREALPKIREMYYDKSVTFQEMYNFVRNCALKGDDLPARRRFLETYLPGCFNKLSIEALCTNSVKKGQNFDDGRL